ncbi:hypothetical protein B2J93_9565 [Marssonina coronariae]|uniref:Uncharacterized protein n=1 Tax=Diplocarpon coronariae TaxID=2795749 RepID=A0A218YUI8_9HELO|nr:hypothetical protein B2J93_9565 [Marssonina coronariae]
MSLVTAPSQLSQLRAQDPAWLDLSLPASRDFHEPSTANTALAFPNRVRLLLRPEGSPTPYRQVGGGEHDRLKISTDLDPWLEEKKRLAGEEHGWVKDLVGKSPTGVVEAWFSCRPVLLGLQRWIWTGTTTGVRGGYTWAGTPNQAMTPELYESYGATKPGEQDLSLGIGGALRGKAPPVLLVEWYQVEFSDMKLVGALLSLIAPTWYIRYRTPTRDDQ